MNSNQKGKRFEREIAKIINKKFDSDVRRTPCSGGLSFKGDIIDLCGPLKEFHFECKNQEKMNIWDALRQAEGDAPGAKTPLVVFTKNFEDTYVALRLNDLLDLIKEIQDLK